MIRNLIVHLVIYKKMSKINKKQIAPTPKELDIKSSNPVEEKPSDNSLLPWIKFYIYREVAGVGSHHTSRAKIQDLQKFVNYFYSKQPDGNTARWTKAVTQSFLNSLSKRHETSSVLRSLATLSHLSNFLEKMKVLDYEGNPVRKIKGPKKEPLQPQGIHAINSKTGEIVLSGEQIYDALINAVLAQIESKPSPILYRNAAILSILYHTGMRVEEVCSITMSQFEIDVSEGAWFRGVKCKGNKLRDIYINEKSLFHLNEYVNIKHKNNKYDKGPIFQSRNGKKLCQSDIWRIIKQTAKIASLSLPTDAQIDVHPHSFRHERAYNLLKKAQMGDAFVADQLGHSNTNYVSRYTRRSEREMVEILKKI